ncbi:hypothetical protein A4H97_18535 [Niastella yeongjuensis]|uniref:Uncharacterized protein n=1 Tax=Niastella yeongjuensis TaxID=354355 RepID=A0A1V9DXW5_9BACT|nr:hypothetical protein [Niastella yeongjuensis]OQP38717.1 hypothetical protein A4H97_18535 [Niastella yeongjuensis]SEO35268.1 hypothetical protein SAMN05660816_02696 [Niastella yeongjuensis]
MVLAAFFHVRLRQFRAVELVLRFAIIVKTTIDVNCTKGHGEIFNKLTDIKKIIQGKGRNANSLANTLRVSINKSKSQRNNQSLKKKITLL